MDSALNSPIGLVGGPTPSKVVPLLASLSRVEELVSSMAMRLDPIVNHQSAAQTSNSAQPVLTTVTARLQGLGDSLQYLLDNIEL